MSKPESIYMWDNFYNNIQIIESKIDLNNRKTDLYDPKHFSQDNDYCSLKSSHIIGEFMRIKKQHNFCMGLSTNLHQLMNGSLRWKAVFIQGGRISKRHFHHLAMNYYLHQKISP